MAEMNNSTPEIRQSEIKGFLRYQQEQGGIVPSRLNNGSVILLDTHQYIYEITVVDTPTGRRYMLTTASPMCKNKTVVTSIRAHSTKLNYNMEDWIGKEMRGIFKFGDGSTVMVGDIRGATVLGTTKKGDPYRYDFWENDNG